MSSASASGRISVLATTCVYIIYVHVRRDNNTVDCTAPSIDGMDAPIDDDAPAPRTLRFQSRNPRHGTDPGQTEHVQFPKSELSLPGSIRQEDEATVEKQEQTTRRDQKVHEGPPEKREFLEEDERPQIHQSHLFTERRRKRGIGNQEPQGILPGAPAAIPGPVQLEQRTPGPTLVLSGVGISLSKNRKELPQQRHSIPQPENQIQ